jgi:hypothetical protein
MRPSWPDSNLRSSRPSRWDASVEHPGYRAPGRVFETTWPPGKNMREHAIIPHVLNLLGTHGRMRFTLHFEPKYDASRWGWSVMKNQFVGKILACILAVALPAATISAETHAAMLYATNTVMLNGLSAERLSAVFAGDSIQTPADGAVRLTVEGSTVMVGPSTALVYEGDTLRLGSGSTMVTTDKGMKTLVQRLQIAPAAPAHTSYQVVHDGGQVLVAALHGSVKISDGSSSTTVAEGNTASVQDPAPAPTQGGGATPGVMIGAGGLSHKQAAIILAGVAAGTIVLVYATTNNGKKPLSPPGQAKK